MTKSPIKKRAQATGAGAASLVALIALLIIFYLLFIPPDVRDEILEGNVSSSGVSDVLRSNSTFLLESPGTLDTITTDEIEHRIPNVNLFASQEAKVLDKFPSVYVKSSAITQKVVNISFVIADLPHTENALLSFTSKVRKGNLVIELNGNEIFNGMIDKDNIDPITLKNKQLIDGENRLGIYAQSVGWRFWKTNEHQLELVQITADVTDVREQLSKNIFVVSTTERNNLDRAIVRFTPECVEAEVGILQVLINGNQIYSAVPECGFRTATEVLPNRFRSGENQIIFKTEKGNYLIDLISITSDLKEPIQPIYYFEVNQTVLDDIATNVYDLVLQMTFVDEADYKIGSIVINGRETGINQKERVYTRDLGDYLVKGNNAIKIVPDTPLDIVRLEVLAKEK